MSRFYFLFLNHQGKKISLDGSTSTNMKKMEECYKHEKAKQHNMLHHSENALFLLLGQNNCAEFSKQNFKGCFYLSKISNGFTNKPLKKFFIVSYILKSKVQVPLNLCFRKRNCMF